MPASISTENRRLRPPLSRLNRRVIWPCVKGSTIWWDYKPAVPASSISSSPFVGTDLETLLRPNGIGMLVLASVHVDTDHCGQSLLVVPIPGEGSPSVPDSPHGAQEYSRPKEQRQSASPTR